MVSAPDSSEDSLLYGLESKTAEEARKVKDKRIGKMEVTRLEIEAGRKET